MIRIKLDCGREVRVDGFTFGYTYGGLIEGQPNERMNQSIFDRTNCPQGWGSRKTLKITPLANEFKTQLKPSYYITWLLCNDPIDPLYDSSELVVVWFGDIPNGKTIEDIVEKGVKSINWDAHAHDFYY